MRTCTGTCRLTPGSWATGMLDAERVPASRVLVVTGASSGIGRAVAEAAASRGNTLVLVARGAAPLQSVAEECRARGAADVTVETADVGDDAAVGRIVAATLDRHVRLDVVVHSAGVVPTAGSRMCPSRFSRP